MRRQTPQDILAEDFRNLLFPLHRRPFPDLDDTYELELAFYEHRLLTNGELLDNGAYFAQVGADWTRHYRICTGDALKLPDDSSRLKSFFVKNIFRTGYATHGLFPYRGKFHPQMIKALLNIMGLKPGQTVLDPMMGSGTTLIEASIMGINSVGIDASPFCRFMTQTKIDALTMSLKRARGALVNYQEVFSYFQSKVGAPIVGSKDRSKRISKDLDRLMEPPADYNTPQQSSSVQRQDTIDTYHFLLLAYLDSAGYAERSQRKTPLDQFRIILERYLFVAEKFQKVLRESPWPLGAAKALEGDARSLPLESASIDGIIFSPPYSFAIDYLANDAFHLDFMGIEEEKLRDKMIGLRGRTLADKFGYYDEDMGSVLSECGRVLKPGKFCTVIIGTNNNQLSKVLGVPPDEVAGLHERLQEKSANYGLKIVKSMSRPITGIANTMRREYILVFQRDG